MIWLFMQGRTLEPALQTASSEDALDSTAMLKALTLLLVLRMMTACAQFELGAGGGAFTQFLRVRVGSSGRPYVNNDHPVLPSFTIAFRDRSKTKGNLFMEFTWMRRMFFAHLDNSGRGGDMDRLGRKTGPPVLGFRTRMGTGAKHFPGGDAVRCSARWLSYWYTTRMVDVSATRREPATRDQGKCGGLLRLGSSPAACRAHNTPDHGSLADLPRAMPRPGHIAVLRRRQHHIQHRLRHSGQYPSHVQSPRPVA